MYSLYDYGLMLADPRAAAYAEAIRRTVRPGDVVVDLGSGPGIWASFACALGARRVYAIESDEVVALAGAIAAANGVSDRVIPIRADSRHVTLDTPADVVVADVRGVLPFTGTSLETMIDARRFLRSGGALIPQRDRVWISVACAPQSYKDIVGPWTDATHGVDATPVREIAVNTWRKARLTTADLVTNAMCCIDLDYRTLSASSAEGRATLVATRATDAHGLAVWFDSDLTNDVQISNRPGEPPLLYGQGFFPWPAIVHLEAGDSVSVSFRARQTSGEYVFMWDTEIAAGASGRERTRFSQSTFHGLPLDLRTTHAHAGDAVIAPGPDAAIERFVLAAFDGVRTQRDIAEALAAKFPDRFASPREALARVVAIALRVARTGGEVALRE